MQMFRDVWDHCLACIGHAITSRVPEHSNDRLPMLANEMQERLLPGMHSLYQLEFPPCSIRYHVALQRAISVFLQGC